MRGPAYAGFGRGGASASGPYVRTDRSGSRETEPQGSCPLQSRAETKKKALDIRNLSKARKRLIIPAPPNQPAPFAIAQQCRTSGPTKAPQREQQAKPADSQAPRRGLHQRTRKKLRTLPISGKGRKTRAKAPIYHKYYTATTRTLFSEKEK